MPFLTMYWKQLALAALALIIFGFGWYKGNAYQKSKFDAFLKQQELLAFQQQTKNDLIKQNQEKMLENTSNAYNDTIKRITAYYENNRPVSNNRLSRVLNNKPSSKSMPDIQKATQLFTESRGNENSATLEQDCAITTAQYNALHEAWTNLCLVSECE